MLFRERSRNHMVEINSLIALMDSNCTEVPGRTQEGEEAQDVENFNKSDLTFLSGEALPQCWTNPHYRDKELNR